MMSMRSNILNGETRLPHVDDLKLKYLVTRYLAYGVFNSDFILDPEEKNFLEKEWSTILSTLYKNYCNHYDNVVKELLESFQYETELIELQKLTQIVKSKLVAIH